MLHQNYGAHGFTMSSTNCGGSSGVLCVESDGERLLLEQYARETGKQLNRTNPQAFSEKLYCRMISWNRSHDPIFTQLSDKYAVRDHVRSKIGQEHLVKLLWHGTDPNAIPFDTLPAEYVIKTNHGSGQIIVVKGDADRHEIIQKLSKLVEKQLLLGRKRASVLSHQAKGDDRGVSQKRGWERPIRLQMLVLRWRARGYPG